MKAVHTERRLRAAAASRPVGNGYETSTVVVLRAAVVACRPCSRICCGYKEISKLLVSSQCSWRHCHRVNAEVRVSFRPPRHSPNKCILSTSVTREEINVCYKISETGVNISRIFIQWIFLINVDKCKVRVDRGVVRLRSKCT